MPETKIKNNCRFTGDYCGERFSSGRSFSWLMILSIFFLSFNTLLTGQNTAQRPSRQAAMDAFNKGDYEAAYTQFTGLLGMFPKDPLYKYYTGICIVNLGKDPYEAVTLLHDAAAGAGTVKPVPEDVWFWLGRAQQMAGMFDEAVASYNKFTNLSGRKIAREMNVPDYIKEASERKGKADLNLSGREPSEPSVPAVQPPPAIAPQNELKEVKVISAEMEPAPAEIDNQLGRLLEDSLRNEEVSGKAVEATVPQPGNLKGGEEKETPVASVKREEKGEKVTDTLNAVAGKTSPALNQPVFRKKPVFTVFEITDKPLMDKIPVNPPVPPGLIYRIQVAIFRNPVAPAYFKGLSPVEGFRNEGSDLTVYYTGLFRKASDASQALPKVRSHGFKDAFIVALMDKKQVSAERAAVLEKEWGSKPLYEEDIEVAPADTVPPTLVFRVELLRSQKPLDKGKTEDIIRLAGDRGLDILTDEKKQNIYLIGIFLTYKSATEYADLLVRNGYKDARVVAYLGKKEIPVDVARKLFEEY